MSENAHRVVQFQPDHGAGAHGFIEAGNHHRPGRRPDRGQVHVLVARAGHPLAECRTLQELKEATWILNRDFAGESDGVVQSAFSDYCSRYAPRIHISHASVIATNLIASTDFLSLMPWPLAELLLVKDGLCVLPIRDGCRMPGSASRIDVPCHWARRPSVLSTRPWP
ncbi:LysR substrate-binding domain-containing protein [Cupriavidus necator]